MQRVCRFAGRLRRRPRCGRRPSRGLADPRSGCGSGAEAHLSQTRHTSQTKQPESRKQACDQGVARWHGSCHSIIDASFGREGHAMINLTNSALNAVRSAMTGAAVPVGGLRIMVEAGGCAGYKYMMGLVDAADPDDTVVERDGVKLFVDTKSQELLTGTTIDFVVALEGSGFTFENPNATSSCSCGKSFG
jgi:iron-sulfur cluster assembly protein